VNAAKVRKDLSYLGSYGTRGVGYEVDYLVYQIRRELGLTHDWPVVIVGAGNLGQALAGYGGFGERGFPVAGIVDIDPAKVGTVLGGVRVRHIDELSQIVQAKRVNIGVVATPSGRRPGRGRPPGQGRGHEHPQLRPGGAVRAPVDRGPQGRSRRRAADPQLPRAAPRRRFATRHAPAVMPCRTRAGRRSASARRFWSVMSIVVIGVNHRTDRSRCSSGWRLSGPSPSRRRSPPWSRDNVREAVVVSTCNRTEVYAVAERFHGAYADIRDFFCEIGGMRADELHPHLYSQHDDAAVSHLFEVAAGLDSAVLGETEILGQVRHAWEVAQARAARAPR
jgi:hypothetical protein